MKALIADDEQIARQVMRELLEGFAEVEIVGEAATGLEAAERIGDLHPDVVFLDLQMPDLDGFAVARSLRGDRRPLVIFVTAYAEHALEAFDTGAVDYLLKPVREERLAAALGKARVQLAGVGESTPERKGQPELQKIVGRVGSDLYLLQPSEVIAFQADHELVYVLTASRRYYSDHSLKELETRLPEPRFRRVHRKTIINTDHIRKISPLSSKRWLLKMSSGLEVVVSRRMAGAIRETTYW